MVKKDKKKEKIETIQPKTDRLHATMTFIFRPLFVKLSFLIIIQSDLILMGHEKKCFLKRMSPLAIFGYFALWG